MSTANSMLRCDWLTPDGTDGWQLTVDGVGRCQVLECLDDGFVHRDAFSKTTVDGRNCAPIVYPIVYRIHTFQVQDFFHQQQHRYSKWRHVWSKGDTFSKAHHCWYLLYLRFPGCNPQSMIKWYCFFNNHNHGLVEHGKIFGRKDNGPCGVRLIFGQPPCVKSIV